MSNEEQFDDRNCQVAELFRQQQFEQALPIAEQARSLADQHWGEATNDVRSRLRKKKQPLFANVLVLPCGLSPSSLRFRTHSKETPSGTNPDLPPTGGRPRCAIHRQPISSSC